MNRRAAFAGAGIVGAILITSAVWLFSSGSKGAPETPAKPLVDLAALRVQAESGDPQAQARLGGLYAGGEQVTNNYAEAAKWYRKAAEQGHAESQFALGELYEAGQGVAKSTDQAIALYRQAAEKGVAKAQYTLGFLYESGRGVSQNQIEATKWFQRAAENGDPLAQYDLGQRYELGVGVAADKIEALKWFSLAAMQGQADATIRRDKLRKTLSREQVAEAQLRTSALATNLSARTRAGLKP